MFNVQIRSKEDNARRTVPGTRCVIGSSAEANLSLSGWRVQKEHAEFFVSNEQVFVRDLASMFGTLVNGKKISTFGPVKHDHVIAVGGYELQVSWNRSSEQTAPPRPAVTSETEIPGGARAFGDATKEGQGPSPTASQSRDRQAANSPVAMSEPLVPSAVSTPRRRGSMVDQGRLELRRSLQDKLIASFDLRRIDIHKMDDDQLRKQAEGALREILKSAELSPTEDKDTLIAEVRDEAIGLGLLEPLLADPEVTEIMVNAYDEIFVERKGMLSRMPLAFSSEKSVMGIIERIVAPVGRRIDESSPLVDARLKDGSRFNAIIPPLALKGPSMTIRKFATKKLTGEDLIRFGSASENMVRFMQIAVQYKKNLIVSGGTGSGKTTLLNILSNFIPDNERIVTIEDAAELRLHHEHLVTLEGRPSNAEGKGAVTIRDLVRNSLRMRPDRIVVGECRGGEALDMLQAMNTGHDGSLTTAHANTPRDMLARLEVMVLMSGMDLPVTAIREQVASAVDIVVQQTRYACGSRKISKICEVTGVESGKIQLQDLFEFVETGFSSDHKVQGYFTACGAVPEFYEKLQAAGMNLDLDIFQKDR